MKVFLGGLAVFLVYCLVYSCNARAEGWHLLELNEMTLETAKIVNFDDPYFPYQDPAGATAEHWTQYTATNFNLDLVEYDHWGLYWNNKVDTASTEARFRMVSWEWEGGANLNDRCQVFWHHHSTHLLDAASDDHFPMTNWYGARVTLYRRDK